MECSDKLIKSLIEILEEQRRKAAQLEENARLLINYWTKQLEQQGD